MYCEVHRTALRGKLLRRGFLCGLAEVEYSFLAVPDLLTVLVAREMGLTNSPGQTIEFQVALERNIRIVVKPNVDMCLLCGFANATSSAVLCDTRHRNDLVLRKRDTGSRVIVYVFTIRSPISVVT